jgi:uncharacterized caspase-like protein
MSKFALLIGVSEYESGLASLPAAVKDVKAVQEILQHPEMGNFDDVKVLIDPGLLEMQAAVNTLFDDRKQQDLVLLYFSGHGITDEYGKFFFANRNTCKTIQGKLNKGTAVPASFIHDVMSNCLSERQVIILDCCHSGAFPEGMTLRNAGTLNLKQELGGQGRIVLTSSTALQYSFERQGEDLAIYTRFLVEGIKTGAADLDGDGVISVNELHDYVEEQVRKVSPAMKPERYVLGDGEKILLAKAFISDPKWRYLKLVQAYAKDGEIRPAGRSLLNKKRKRLGLVPEEAKIIEDSVLAPYLEHQENLQEYEYILNQEIKHEFPLSERACRELNALQDELGLTDKNVKQIREKIIKDLGITKTIASQETLKEGQAENQQIHENRDRRITRSEEQYIYFESKDCMINAFRFIPFYLGTNEKTFSSAKYLEFPCLQIDKSRVIYFNDGFVTFILQEDRLYKDVVDFLVHRRMSHLSILEQSSWVTRLLVGLQSQDSPNPLISQMPSQLCYVMSIHAVRSLNLDIPEGTFKLLTEPSIIGVTDDPNQKILQTEEELYSLSDQEIKTMAESHINIIRSKTVTFYSGWANVIVDIKTPDNNDLEALISQEVILQKLWYKLFLFSESLSGLHNRFEELDCEKIKEMRKEVFKLKLEYSQFIKTEPTGSTLINSLKEDLIKTSKVESMYKTFINKCSLIDEIEKIM